MSKNTICLWYDKDAEAAARFYAETFPDSLPLDSMLRTVRGWPFSLRACLQLFRLRKIVGLNRPYFAHAGEQDCRC